MGTELRRPDPEELLRRIQAEEAKERRGRLKVFLGYASRVGKSLRMLDEGRRRKARGQDVVIGAIQSKTTPDLEVLAAQLESVPMRREEYAGRVYDVIDTAALFARRPQVCLIDELAYENPPGSRHPHRWQDVEDLLEHGITVVTAVNLQYVDDQQDAVAQVTGKRAAQTVPGSFLRNADEIVLVDAAPEDLAIRPGQPVSDDVRRTTVLRELALLLAADVVEKQLQEYLECHGMPQARGTQERILVCLTPCSTATVMLASAQRNAARFHGALLACYVEQESASEEDRRRVAAHLEFARSLGAEVHTLRGTDFVDTILRFARQQRVTQLFVGHSFNRRPSRFFRSPAERLIDQAEEFDVRLFPHQEAK